jgi:hypothetical protein
VGIILLKGVTVKAIFPPTSAPETRQPPNKKGLLMQPLFIGWRRERDYSRCALALRAAASRRSPRLCRSVEPLF